MKRVFGSRWVKATALVFAVLTGGGVVWTYLAEREVVREVEVLNPEGTEGTALVVYHPGLTDFMPEVIHSFAKGLTSRDWRVEMVTASSQAPTDVSRYDLLVVGAPTYWWTPARPASRYLERIGNLEGKPTAVVVTASGQIVRSQYVLERQIEEAGGEIGGSVALLKFAPNREGDPRPNEVVALEIAYQTGEEVGAEASAD